MADSNNDELVSQFLVVTGSADPAQATSYLEMSGGNLETAVSLYMEHNHSTGVEGLGGGGLEGPPFRPPPVAGGPPSGAGLGPMGSPEIRAPDATRTMRLMDDSDILPVNPAFHLMNAMMEEEIAQSAFADAMDVRAAVNAAAQEREEDEDKENEDDGKEDEDIVAVMPPAPARLSDMFAPPTHLIHKAGGFQGARAVAKDARRWLLVNLQRDAEFSCHALNRDVWRDELVENLVREGFIFWQAMDSTTEGQTYAERYQVTDYPHIAIIDPRTGRLMWKKEGWTQEKPMTAEIFAETAMDFCSRHSFDKPPVAPRPSTNGGAASSSLPSKRPMHEMSEDEQLQAAMQASLRESSENVVDVDGGNDMDDDDGDDDVEFLGTEEDMKMQAEEKKPSFSDELLEVPVGDEPEDGARIQLRMPDGKRSVRKFAGTDKVKVIYAFVAQSNEEARGGREFTLMAGYPPNDMINDIENTIESCNLSGQAITVRWK